MKNILRHCIFILALIAFLLSSTVLTSRFMDTHHEQKLLDEIKVEIYGEEKESATDDWFIQERKNSFFSDRRHKRQKSFYSLYTKNNDLTGWIQIDDTKIDYPIMQSPADADFYLKHDFNKEKSSYGSIYLDAGCSIEYSKNLILYGHHMKDGSMFAKINDYQYEDFYLGHPIIQFDTLGSLNDYQIIGAFKIPSSDINKLEQVLLMDTKEDFFSVKEYFESHKYYDTGIPYSYEDNYLTLMTCEYTNKNGRFFVLAKQIRMETNND